MPFLLSTDTTGTVATLLEIDQNEKALVFLNREKERIVIESTDEIVYTLKANKNYFIVYESRWWFTKPKLISAKLMPDDV